MQALMTVSKQSQNGILTLLRSFMQVFMTVSKQSQDGILTLLRYGHEKLHETYQSRMYSREILMMGREDARNM